MSEQPGGTGNAKLRLFGHAPAAVELEIEPRPRGIRLRRALVALAACWLAIPVVALVPPHVPWALIAFAAGLYLARRQWKGVAVVKRFDGRCPNCKAPIRIEAGSLLDLPAVIDCAGCHHQLRLEVS